MEARASTPTRAASGSGIAATRSGFVWRPEGADTPFDRRLDIGIAVVLVVAVLLQGVREAFGLPGAIELLADLAAGVLLLWIGWAVLRSGRAVAVPYLVIAFAVLMVACALSADELPRMLVSAKNFLFLPLLAMAIAALGPSEDRARIVVWTAIGLVILQFAVTIGQSLAGMNVDLIVGTFGDYAGPSTAFALEVGACLALGAYARSGRPVWLALALVLPIAAIWTALRLMLLVIPVAGLAVAVAAWWAERGGSGAGSQSSSSRTRRPAAILAVVAVTTGAIFGGYAIWRPSDLGVITDSDSRTIYLDEADVVVEPDTATEPVTAEEVPGRRVQIETAMRLVNNPPLDFLIGRGLGVTTYAENLDIEMPEEKDLVVVGYMDAGTLLVETGWLGVALVLSSALLIGLGAMSAARRELSASWIRALLIAYPGILVSMAAGAFHGTPFRNLGSATLFWVLTGLVAASVLQPSRSSAATPR